MNVGDKVLAEGEVTAVGEGFYRVRFPRVGAEAVTHVRVAKDRCKAVEAPKAGRRAAAD